ncbi:MAG: type I 3-dehydroquinate dehydratase, partial [Candidatus Anstonellaceae archaeon]
MKSKDRFSQKFDRNGMSASEFRYNGKICVSIGNCALEKCLEALEGLEFAEVRLDSLSDINEESMQKIFARKAKLIATCRPNGRVDDVGRKKLLLAAIENGAAFVDVEVGANEKMRGEIIAAARKRGCAAIVSFHDFEKTPASGELRRIVEQCFDSGADIAKIACKVKSKRDAARLLGLLESGRKMVVIGMGKRGKIVRIAAPLLGSQFTFASLGRGKETADGQI